MSTEMADGINLDQRGQHYMIDKDLLRFIVTYGELEKDDVVLEIGPGHGELTQFLIRKCKTIAIDIDPKCELKSDNVVFIEGNIIGEFELLYKKYFFNKIISNIPYTISEPLMRKIFKTDVDLVVLVVGKSFADSLVDETQKHTNRIAIIANEFYDIELLKIIKPKSFRPQPRVDSAVIRCIPKALDDLSVKGAIYKKLVLHEELKLKNAFEKIMSTKTKKQLKALTAHSLFNKRLYQLSNEEFLAFDHILDSFVG